MADTAVQQNVTLNLGVKTDADIAKPMKDLASASARAAEGQKLVQERLDGITARLKSTADTAGMFNKVLGKSFGFENVEVGIKQITNRINDSVFRLKGQMEHFKISGDASPILRTLQGVQGQVKKLQDQAKLGITGAMAGGREAMGGIHTALRGGMMLTAGDESLEKTFQTLMKFQAVTDVMHGLGSAVHGTVSGLTNLARAAKASAAAGGAISLIQGITGAGGAAGGAAGAAGGAAGGGAGLIGKFAPTLGALAGAAPIATAIGGAAVAITAVGAAAVIASPKLQYTLGKAIYELGEEAKHAAERIKKAEEAVKADAKREKFGLASQDVEGWSAARFGVSAPLEEHARALREQRDASSFAGEARARFPTQPFAAGDRQRQNAEILEQLHRQASTGHSSMFGAGRFGLTTNAPGLGNESAIPGPMRANVMHQQLFAGMDPGFSQESQAAVYQARLHERSSGRELERLREEGAALERRRELTGVRGAYKTNEARLAELGGGVEGGEIGALRRQLQAKKGVGRSGQYGVMAFEEPTKEGGELQRKLGALERERDSLKAEQDRLRRRTTGARLAGVTGGDVTKAEEDDFQKRQQEGEDRHRQEVQKTTAAIHAQNQERIDGLKKASEELAAQSKQYRELLAQQEQQIKSTKASLGLSDPETIGRLAQIGKMFKTGHAGQLTPEQVALAGQHKELFGDRLEKEGIRRAEKSPLIMGMMREGDLEKRHRETGTEAGLINQGAEQLRDKTKAAVAANAKLMGDLEEKFREGTEVALKAIADRMVKMMGRMAAEVAASAAAEAVEKYAATFNAGRRPLTTGQ